MRLAIVALRRVTPVGLLATFLCQVIVASGGVLFPLLLQTIISWGDYTTFGYTMLQLPNYFWTLYEIAERSNFGGWELAIIVGSVGGVIFLLFHDVKLSVTFGLALIINLFVASLAGVLAPLVLDRIGRDPAVSSSVFVTFATDFTGFLSFLGLAALILL